MFYLGLIDKSLIWYVCTCWSWLCYVCKVMPCQVKRYLIELCIWLTNSAYVFQIGISCFWKNKKKQKKKHEKQTPKNTASSNVLKCKSVGLCNPFYLGPDDSHRFDPHLNQVTECTLSGIETLLREGWGGSFVKNGSKRGYTVFTLSIETPYPLTTLVLKFEIVHSTTFLCVLNLAVCMAFCGVWSGSTLFAKVCLSQYLVLLRYSKRKECTPVDILYMIFPCFKWTTWFTHDATWRQYQHNVFLPCTAW